LDAEDPLRWLKRLESAVSRHEKMILKIKHRFYIEKMSTEGLQIIDEEYVKEVKS
jgi:dynein heavy chain